MKCIAIWSSAREGIRWFLVGIQFVENLHAPKRWKDFFGVCSFSAAGFTHWYYSPTLAHESWQDPSVENIILSGLTPRGKVYNEERMKIRFAMWNVSRDTKMNTSGHVIGWTRSVLCSTKVNGQIQPTVTEFFLFPLWFLFCFLFSSTAKRKISFAIWVRRPTRPALIARRALRVCTSKPGLG